MNTTDCIYQAALELCKTTNRVTTLEIKMYLRTMFPSTDWKQQDISISYRNNVSIKILHESGCVTIPMKIQATLRLFWFLLSTQLGTPQNSVQ